MSQHIEITASEAEELFAEWQFFQHQRRAEKAIANGWSTSLICPPEPPVVEDPMPEFWPDGQPDPDPDPDAEGM